MRHAISWKALDNGITECNENLRAMCGGEQLVRINGGWAWACDPEHSELTYSAKPGAPEEAVERARRICHHLSYDRTFEVVDAAYMDNWIYDAWQVSNIPLDVIRQ